MRGRVHRLREDKRILRERLLKPRALLAKHLQADRLTVKERHQTPRSSRKKDPAREADDLLLLMRRRDRLGGVQHKHHTDRARRVSVRGQERNDARDRQDEVGRPDRIEGSARETAVITYVIRSTD